MDLLKPIVTALERCNYAVVRPRGTSI
jgi:hypothetical protein